MVRQSRPLPESPEHDAITRSVRDNFISPLIADFKVEACNADSTSVLIQINDIYDGSETSINNVFDNINLGTSAVKDLSRILSIKAFPNNIVATSELTTKVREGMSSVNVTVEVSSSLVLLPEKPMMGRLDDPKVGYFTKDLLYFSDSQQKTEEKNTLHAGDWSRSRKTVRHICVENSWNRKSRLYSISRTLLPTAGESISSRE